MFQTITGERFSKPTTPFDPGPAPMLNWLEIDQLVVDLSYQREISRRGAMNIHQIAANFDWSKFAPVIVAPVEGGKFAVVDGQHRTTAAHIRGIETVPCQVVQADRAKQAAAYTAVNGHVTKTTPQQLFHARLAAGDPTSLQLAEVCAAGGVQVSRRNLGVNNLKPGQTQSIRALARCLEQYGRDTLITALQCITQTSDGNPGMVRPTFIEGLCAVLQDEPEWRESGERLLRAMDDFEFADVWEKAIAEHSYVLSPSVRTAVIDAIRSHLRTKMVKGKQKRAA